MKYIVENIKTGRSYTVEGPIARKLSPEQELEMVWMGEKYWFLSPATVRITDENGNSKVFTK